ncbi:unnamed protein product [Didymodactylos carnosus]|uniref:Uncharacterized protein n=1 Tax=Didymodactylos carnosus TaxID=1234261 RepID=A0A814WUC3_9BILA|nr:unnamed protein product [Didymodactylos carnosus]CAF3971141.1 unnamed protein product [Didymodactylos carnosus]
MRLSSELDSCVIDLQNQVQINKQDKHKRLSVKRVANAKREDYLQQERFCLPQQLGDILFNDKYVLGFVRQWRNKSDDPRCDGDIFDIVKKADEDIMVEGKNLRKLRNAEWLATKLRANGRPSFEYRAKAQLLREE